MNFQIYKLTNDKWNKIEIEDVIKDDIIRVYDLDNKEYIENSRGGITNICTKGVYKDKNNELSINSEPYILEKQYK